MRPTNAVPRQVEKFDKLAAMWWDPRGPMRSLHAVNPIRTNFIKQVSDLRNRRVLDVGCGAGLLSESLARLGAQVTGIDLAGDLLETARLHASQMGLLIAYRHLSPEQLAEQQPGTYDVVACMEVLEHIPQPASVVAACSHLLKAGGDAYFSTIDRTAKSFLFVVLGAEYLLRLLPMGSHHYRGLIRPAELRTWAAQNGLDFRRHAGISYGLLARQFRIVEKLDDNYMMHFRKSGTSNG